MSLPIGSIIPFVGTKDSSKKLEDQGWLLCDGRPFRIREYPALFDVIGTGMGGDILGPKGSTENTFYLPDLRGMFLRGVAEGYGDPDAKTRTQQGANGNVGDAVGTRQAHQLESHTHKYAMVKAGDYTLPTGGGSYKPHGDDTTLDTASAGGSETRPVNVSVYYLIYAGGLKIVA